MPRRDTPPRWGFAWTVGHLFVVYRHRIRVLSSVEILLGWRRQPHGGGAGPGFVGVPHHLANETQPNPACLNRFLWVLATAGNPPCRVHTQAPAHWGSTPQTFPIRYTHY